MPPRTKKARCAVLRCSRTPTVLGLCRQDAVAEADRLCRDIVMRRDRYRCTRCGTTERLQWSHHITRARYWVRWDLLNSTVHCAGCHKLLTEHPLLHHETIVGLISSDALEELMDRCYGPVVEDGRRLSPGPFRGSDLEATVLRLRQMAAGCEGVA